MNTNEKSAAPSAPSAYARIPEAPEALESFPRSYPPGPDRDESAFWEAVSRRPPKVAVGVPALGSKARAISENAAAPATDVPRGSKEDDSNQKLIGTPAGDDLLGTPGDDDLFGLDGDDNLSGGAGVDLLSGGDGSDMLHGGSGDDFLLGGTGDDDLVGWDGNDFLNGGAGNDTLRGGAGNDILRGGAGEDILDGGRGNDVVYGGSRYDGGDIFRYRSGDGDDVVNFVSTLELLDLNPADVKILGHKGIRDLKTGQTIRLPFEDGEYHTLLLNKIKFANGVVWGRDQIDAVVNASEFLMGTTGDDLIEAYGGNDVLEGGQGNDTLDGGSGDDTYRYRRGDGNDRIVDRRGYDTLMLSDLNAADVRLNANGQGELELLINTGGRIVIGGHREQIERIVFADGSFWDEAALNAAMRKGGVFSGTPGDDDLTGWDGNDSLSGGDGNDRMDGGAGNDTLTGGDGNDYLEGSLGDDVLYGGAGNDTLYGGPGRDILEGGLGDDKVNGDSGNSDVFRYRSGDGNDRIDGIERIDLLDLNPADVRLLSQSDDRRTQGIIDRKTGQTIIGSVGYGGPMPYIFVREIAFANGTVWDTQQILAAFNANETLSGTDGDDVIDGYAGNDTLEGAEGNDTLRGGDGNDTYLYYRGDGNDTIVDGSGNDTLELSRLKPADVGLSVSGRGDLELLIRSTGDRITIGSDTTGVQIDRVVFSKGASWEAAVLTDALSKDRKLSGTDGNDDLSGGVGNDTLTGGNGDDRLRGSDGNDTLVGGTGIDFLYGDSGSDKLDGGTGDDYLVGGEGSDVLDGGAGNDYLAGGAGNDTFLLQAGSGCDIIIEEGGAAGGRDTVLIGAGIAANQLWFKKIGDDLQVSVVGTQDWVLIMDWSFYRPIEQFVLSDGKALWAKDVQNLVEAMAGFAPPAVGAAGRADSYRGSLDSAIAANWH